MSYRETLEKLNGGLIKRLLIIAAQDVFLTEAAKNNSDPKTLMARQFLGNPEMNGERLANLALVLDQSLQEDSPDSKYRKAIDDVFDIILST